jgi:hypothetical protein
MIDDHWNPTSPIWTIPSPVAADAGKQVWCALREGRTLSCQVREAPQGWEVVLKTGIDTTRLRWLVQRLRRTDQRFVNCCRASQRIVLTRPCANEPTARFLALALKSDYLQIGWVECS